MFASSMRSQLASLRRTPSEPPWQGHGLDRSVTVNWRNPTLVLIILDLLPPTVLYRPDGLPGVGEEKSSSDWFELGTVRPCLAKQGSLGPSTSNEMGSNSPCRSTSRPARLAEHSAA
jgi:hypothetical protein